MKYVILSISFFLLTGFTLTVDNSGGGKIISSTGKINCGAQCSGNYTSKKIEHLKAVPDTGYAFVGWSGDCTGSGICSLAMSGSLGNKTVNARFISADEANRLPYSNELSKSGMIAFNSVWEEEGIFKATNVAKAGATIRINGKGFSKDFSQNLVVFIGDKFSHIEKPTGGNSSELVVTVPNGVDSFFVVNNGYRSNKVELNILTAAAPVLNQPTPFYVYQNDVTTIKGKNFSPPIIAYLGGKQFPTTVLDSNTIEIILPDATQSGHLSVSNSHGSSNAIEVNLLKRVEIIAELPAGAKVEKDRLHASTTGSLNESGLDVHGHGYVSVEQNRFELIDLSWRDEKGIDRIYLLGWAVPPTERVTLSVATTAEALVALIVGVRGVDNVNALHAMSIIRKNALVIELSKYLDSYIATHSELPPSNDETYRQTIASAAASVLEQLTAKSKSSM